jgi:cytochrome c-type biogenesis protein CcmH/NrfF
MPRVCAAIVIALLCATPALADPDDIAARISNEVMSPFCDGVTLHDCPSDEADELRREIAAWAEQGMSEDAIFERLEREYGVVRGSPDSPAAWLLPAVAALGGIAVVVGLARRWTRKPADEALPVSPDERARIDAELGAYRGGS